MTLARPVRRRFTPLIAFLTTTSNSNSNSSTIRSSTTIRSSSTTSMIISTEKTFECSDGVTLATCHWSNFESIPETAPARTPTSMSSPTRRILCLHGWLDNAASFHRLAPLMLLGSSQSAAAAVDDDDKISLAIPKTEIVALDFPGHGKSGHKSVDGPPQLLAEYAYYAAELVEALQWGNHDDEGGNTDVGASGSRTSIGNVKRNTGFQDNNTEGKLPITASSNTTTSQTTTTATTTRNKIILVGHSMGAGVATILCAAFPEWFSSLILLEGGLVARNANDAARHVRAACQRRLKSNRTLFPKLLGVMGTEEGIGLPPPRPPARAKVYSDLDVAINARLSTTERMPGDQTLSYEAARELVLRATTPAATPTVTTSDSSSSENKEAVVFVHDSRLQWPSLQYYTREQVEAFYRDVHASQIPVCCVVATDGWPVESWAENLVTNVLKPVYLKKLSGSHHFHADPTTVHAVAEHVLAFFEEQKL